MEQGIGRIDTALHEMFPNTSANKKVDDVITMTKAYFNYKRKYFSPKEETLSKVTSLKQCSSIFSATMLEHAPLEAVYIYFDTATYDEIESDVKVMFGGISLSPPVPIKKLI